MYPETAIKTLTLSAYADGVNAFIKQADGNLPLEFKIFGITPQPWTPIDSLVFGKLVAWGLSNNYQDELIISQWGRVPRPPSHTCNCFWSRLWDRFLTYPNCTLPAQNTNP